MDRGRQQRYSGIITIIGRGGIMATISLYAKGVTVEDLHGEELYDRTGNVQVTLNDVDAGDFTSEYNLNEVLDQYEFSDIHDWVTKRLDE